MAIGILLIAAILIVGALIFGAVLVTRPETRTAGITVIGLTLGVVIAGPLVWYLSASAPAPQRIVLDEHGREVVIQTANEPARWMILAPLLLLAAIVGVVVLIVNPRTRTIGLVCLGIGVAGLLAMGIALPTVSVKSPPAQVVQESQVYDGFVQSPTEAIPQPQGPGKLPAKTVTPGNRAMSSTAPEATAPSVNPPTETKPVATPPAIVAPADATAAKPEAAAPKATSPEAKKSQPQRTTASALGAQSPADTPLTIGDNSSRPEWVKTGGGLQPDGSYFSVISTGPFPTFGACWQRLQNSLDGEIRSRSQMIQDWSTMPYRRLPDEIRQQAIQEYYLEKGDFSVGEMMTLHTRLVFSPQFRESVRSWRNNVVAESRVWFTSMAGAILIGFLAVIYGYLRLDTVTRGYYTWRWRALAGLLMFGLVIASIALVDIEMRSGGLFN